MSIHAMRGQIIAYYSNLLATLEQFPTLRNNYFMLGRPNEKKRPQVRAKGQLGRPVYRGGLARAPITVCRFFVR